MLYPVKIKSNDYFIAQKWQEGMVAREKRTKNLVLFVSRKESIRDVERAMTLLLWGEKCQEVIILD